VDGGDIKDEPQFVALLKEFATANALGYVKVSLPEEKAYLFQTEVPSANFSSIAQNIEFKLDQNVPLSAADALFQFDLMPKSVAGETLRASVSVVPRTYVEHHISLLREAHLEPVAFEVSKKIKQGILVKNGKKDGITSYNLKITVGEDDFVFKDIVQLFDNPTQGALTRMLSLLLRHNVPVQYIVEQLQKDKYSDMTSFARVIARVLKAYIPDGVKSTSEKKCDVCGAEGTLIYQEGCVKCSACGNSRCG
jgi:hypothetical protein